MARVAARVETTLWFRVRGLLISAQVAPAPRRVRASRVSPLVSGDYDAAGGGVRGVGLEPMGRAAARVDVGAAGRGPYFICQWCGCVKLLVISVGSMAARWASSKMMSNYGRRLGACSDSESFNFFTSKRESRLLLS